MIAFVFLGLVLQNAGAATRFEDVARALMDTSDQAQVVTQDRIRTELEYKVALGSLYDPTLRASFWDRYRGDFQTRRLDVSVLQRTGIWGINFLGGYRFGRGYFAPYETGYETQDSGEARFGVEIPLLRNGWTDSFRTSLRKGEISVSLSEYQEQVQRLELLRQLGVRYWEWFVNAQRFRVSKELLDLALVRQEKIRIRVVRGDLAKIEELEGDRTILQRRSLLAQAERNFTRVRLDLDAFLSQKSAQKNTQNSTEALNLGIDSLPPLDLDLPKPETLTGAGIEIDQHPEVLRQNALLDQARLDADLAKNQFLPKLDLALNLSQDFGTPVSRLGQPSGDAGISFEFPIPSRAASARTSQMEAMVIRQDAQVSLARTRIGNSVEDAKIALGLAHERALLASQELELSKTLVEMENKRFLNGDSNLLLLNLREQNYAEAEIRRIEAFSDFRRSANDLNVALGRLEF